MPIDEDNDMSVLAYHKYLEDDAERNKKKTASEFEELGNQFLKEIDKKKKRKKLTQSKIIPYILKHAGDIYEEDELKSYSLEDVLDIYDEVRETKKQKRSGITNFFHFLFNIE